jgi:hypothetical protein
MDQPIVGAYGGGLTRVASNGAGYLVAWVEQRSGVPFSRADVFAARVDPAGALLDGTGLALAVGEVDPTDNLDVASDGSGYLVVWTRYLGSGDSDVVAARVAADGTASPPIVISSQPFEQGRARVAFGEGTYLVAWEDCRGAAPSGCQKSGGRPDVYAARVSPAGAVLDPAGVLVAPIASGPGNPDVAHDGASFVVTFADCRDPIATCGYYTTKVFAARVAAGAVLDPGGIPVSAPGGRAPTVSPTASGSLVAWTASPTGVQAARVAAGAVLDPTPITITTSAISFDVRAAANGAVLAAWTDLRLVQNNTVTPQIYGARVAADGSVLDPAGLLLSPPGEPHDSPALASNGAGWLAVWAGTQGTRVDAAGTPLDTVPLVLSRAANRQRAPALAHDGQGYLVAWEDSRGATSSYPARVVAARIDAAGAVLDPSGIVFGSPAASQIAPAVASNGAGYLATWVEGAASSALAIKAARLGLDGAILDPAGIVLLQGGAAGVYDCRPSAASDGSRYAIVWRCLGVDSVVVGGAVIAADGSVPASVHPPAAGWPTFSGPPAIAFHGSGYLVAWGEGPGRMLAARVAAGGSNVDTTPLVLASAGATLDRPSVACGAGTCLVVWEACDNLSQSPCPGSQVFGARFGAASGVLDTKPFPISTHGTRREAPSVAFDGDRFVVTWQDDTSGSLDLVGTWIALDGTVLEPAGVPISSFPTEERAPALAGHGGGEALAVYQRFDTEAPFDNVRVRARFLSFVPDGSSSGTGAGGGASAGSGGASAGSGGGFGGSGGASGGSGGASAGSGGGFGGSGGAPGGSGGTSGGSGGAPGGSGGASAGSIAFGGCACLMAPEPSSGRIPWTFAGVLVALAAARRRR